MDVRGMIWMGINTPRYQETASFFREVLGLTVVLEGSNTVEFECPNGTRVQVTGAASSSCPVPLFEVENLGAAVAELRAAGLRIVSDLQEDEAWKWVQVLGPNGHRYEFATRK
jgi:catechol 2,3-dioxygenase-like lactoylglutathione lyase family enzyme